MYEDDGLAVTSPSPNKVMFSKKILYGFILITVIAIALATWFFLNQTNEVNQTNNVKITEFSAAENWSYLGGMAVTWDFNITIQNMRSKDVNVTLLVVMLGNSSELGRNSWGPVTLRAGEEREFRGSIITTVDSPRWTSYVATLNLVDGILDERKLP